MKNKLIIYFVVISMLFLLAGHNLFAQNNLKEPEKIGTVESVDKSKRKVVVKFTESNSKIKPGYELGIIFSDSILKVTVESVIGDIAICNASSVDILSINKGKVVYENSNQLKTYVKEINKPVNKPVNNSGNENNYDNSNTYDNSVYSNVNKWPDFNLSLGYFKLHFSETFTNEINESVLKELDFDEDDIEYVEGGEHVFDFISTGFEIVDPLLKERRNIYIYYFHYSIDFSFSKSISSNTKDYRLCIDGVPSFNADIEYTMADCNVYKVGFSWITEFYKYNYFNISFNLLYYDMTIQYSCDIRDAGYDDYEKEIEIDFFTYEFEFSLGRYFLHFDKLFIGAELNLKILNIFRNETINEFSFPDFNIVSGYNF